MEIEYKCNKCGSVTGTALLYVEDIILNDPHNPDIEYIQCVHCSQSENITNRKVDVVIIKDGQKIPAKISSDTHQLYLTFEKTVLLQDYVNDTISEQSDC